MQFLSVAHNNLSGPIPAVLQNLSSLSKLDLSFNNLQGEVPKEGIFRNLSSALATTGALVLLAIIIALVHLIYKRHRQKQKSTFKQPILEEQFERVSYHALETGTNGFSEDNLLGKGSFGAVFNLERSGSTKSFIAESQALRMVRHRCLIKIITSCSSINHQGQEFKALVFEFMQNGSLNCWLHKRSDIPTLNNTLSLAQRLDIAVDTMDALEYLHNHCQPPIVHCDLKPSNILLAEDMKSASRTLQNSNSTIGIRGSIGYVAPEYSEGSPITTLGDVYSLGILLLEMFTGRNPTDHMFTGSLDLHQYSEEALPDKIWEIANTTMWLHKETHDSSTRNRIENCLGHVIALGISCSRKHPKERTLIQDAAAKMHAIRDSYRTTGGGT
ncbi:hypothetical protein HU200_055521 [Digitaria exilis]|uniref:non-specific serine/threonine protein kinase n=1 Tax=Digitaria exilis TaxID=1010633 RepID=A0A835E1E2_9POAL|nr:hypothetical protein HU200_055521 [Digitaria exilis]